jgi:hypothetical protein
MKNIGVFKLDGKNYLVQKFGPQIYINCNPIEHYKSDIRDRAFELIKKQQER